jgi:type II secretory pathway pseudopilin PulG
MTPRTHSRRPGFSPVDLLVVIGLLLLFAALLGPAVARVRDAAARTQSLNNLKQLGLAIHNFAGAYNNRLPPGVGEEMKKNGTIHFHLLPFLEQGPLYNQGTDAVWDNNVWSTRITLFLDPRDASGPPGNVYSGWLATTNYAANAMVFSEKPRYRIGNIPDGTSNTLMFATRNQMCSGTPTAWGYPSLYTWAPLTAHYNQSLPQFSLAREECDPTRPQAIGNLLLIALCDGSVRSISPRISATTWFCVCCPDDGEPLGADFID